MDSLGLTSFLMGPSRTAVTMLDLPHVMPPGTRRRALQIGGLGLFGLSLADVERVTAETGAPPKERSVLLVYLPGGLSHIDSFDPKPQASNKTRGDFDVISTRVPDFQICEHLPRLAARSHRWSLVRSFGHPTNDHTQAHHYVLCGKMELPTPFNRVEPVSTDFPSMTSIVGAQLKSDSALPSAVMLPRLLINVAKQVRGGQTAGRMLVQCTYEYADGSTRMPYFSSPEFEKLGFVGESGSQVVARYAGSERPGEWVSGMIPGCYRRRHSATSTARARTASCSRT